MANIHFVSINIPVESDSEDRPTDEEIIHKLKSCIINDSTLDANVETEFCPDFSEN